MEQWERELRAIIAQATPDQLRDMLRQVQQYRQDQERQEARRQGGRHG